MEVNFEIIRGILERRLRQADIERLLGGLSDTEKTQLLIRITELVRCTTALVDVANRVSDTLSLDVLFPRLMEVVTETLNAERSSLFLYDPETRELFSRVMQGNAMGEVRFPANQGIAGSVFTSGKGRSFPTPMPTPASIARSILKPAIGHGTSFVFPFLTRRKLSSGSHRHSTSGKGHSTRRTSRRWSPCLRRLPPPWKTRSFLRRSSARSARRPCCSTW